MLIVFVIKGLSQQKESINAPCRAAECEILHIVFPPLLQRCRGGRMLLFTVARMYSPFSQKKTTLYNILAAVE